MIRVLCVAQVQLPTHEPSCSVLPSVVTRPARGIPAHSRRRWPARPQPAQRPGRRRGPDDDGPRPHAPPTQRASPTIKVEAPFEQVRPRGTGDAEPRRSLGQTLVRFGLGRRPRHDLLPPARVGSEGAVVPHLVFPERRNQREEPRHQLRGCEPKGGRPVRPRALESEHHAPVRLPFDPRTD
jgi:hypothetical protein